MKRKWRLSIAIICSFLLYLPAVGFADSVDVNLNDSVPQAVLDQSRIITINQ